MHGRCTAVTATLVPSSHTLNNTCAIGGNGHYQLPIILMNKQNRPSSPTLVVSVLGSTLHVAVYRRQCICSQHTIMAPCNFAAQLHNTHIRQLQIISNATCMLIRTLLISTVESSHDTVATGWTESTPTALANQASFCIKE